MATTFQVEDIFKITGRGIVVAGKISEGIIYTGDFIKLEVNGEIKIRKISGVEGFGRSSNPLIGLLIATESEKEMIEIREWRHNNFIAEIIPSERKD